MAPGLSQLLVVAWSVANRAVALLPLWAGAGGSLARRPASQSQMSKQASLRFAVAILQVKVEI